MQEFNHTWNLERRIFMANPTRDDYDDSKYTYDPDTDTLTEIYGSNSYDGDGDYIGYDD